MRALLNRWIPNLHVFSIIENMAVHLTVRRNEGVGIINLVVWLSFLYIWNEPLIISLAISTGIQTSK